MLATMSPRERLEAVFARQEPDRTPILGGWIACPAHIQALAGASEEEYWSDPVGVSIRAYEVLGDDGLVSLYVPPSRSDYRCVDASSYVHAEIPATLEEVLERIDAMPGPEQVEARFDFQERYAAFRQQLLDMQERCGEMVWMPAQWSAGARITWYGDFGYQHFFHVVGMYPDRARKLMEVGGAQGRCQGRLIAQAVREGLYPHAVLLGEDICTQRGPMISPRFMERYYAPALRYGLEPLLEVGCQPVWHCDGDVRPLLDMLLDCGVQGLQGFQPECGMSLERVIRLRTREGQRLIIFGPLAVTTELPLLRPQEVRQRVHRAIDLCRGNAHLVLFSANTINPDIPLENIRAMHQAVHTP